MTLRGRFPSTTRTGWIAALFGCALLLAGAAGAVVIKGKGELFAAGNGLAIVTMRGGASISGAGLAIVEEAAIVELGGHGRTTRLDDGRLLLEGFGRVVLASRDDRMRFEIAGAHLRLRARGVGVAILKGKGRVWTSDHDAEWGPESSFEFEGGDEQ